MSQKRFCITAEDFYKLILEKHPDKENELKTEEIAFIVFPMTTIAFLKRIANLEEQNWLMNSYSFYAYPTKFWKGKYKGITFNVVQPPMGDSGTAAVVEQLISCGTKMIILVCGAWGIRETLKIGDICIPELSRANNKIAETYDLSREIKIEKSIFESIINQAKQLGIPYSSGSNVSFESFYRMQKKLLLDEKKRNTLTAENGELHTLLSIGNEFRIRTGAIFYNYFMPLKKASLDIPSKFFIEGGQKIGKIALNLIADFKFN